MSIELITGYAAAGHVSSGDAGRFNAGICGTDEYVLQTGEQFAYTLISNNQIRIGSGDAVIQGRHVSIHPNSYEDVTIETGTTGFSRIDIVGLQYSKDTETGVESASVVVVKGTPVQTGATVPLPTIPTGNIFDGDMTHVCPLYRVWIDGLTIAEVDRAFKILTPMSSLVDIIYPVGAIYISANSTSPATLFGGSWTQIGSRFLIAADASYPAGTTGGAAEVTLTEDQIPSHTHTAPSHTHTGPSHTHTFTTGNQSANHTHGTGQSGYVFTTNKPVSTASVGRRKIATGSACYAMTATGNIEDISEHSATGGQSASHNHSGTTAASGTGATGAAGASATTATGGGGAHNNMPPYLSVYMWQRTQ